MKYFYDTEFIEDGKTIDLISIGIVGEDGKYFYAESDAVDWSKANDFVKAEVVPHLDGPTSFNYMSRADIAKNLLTFFGTNRVELWSWFGAYDHVALAQLFGKMIDMPGNLPWFTHEIEQLRKGRDLPPRSHVAHNALNDAYYHWKMWQYWSD